MKYDGAVNDIRDEMINSNYTKALKLCKNYLNRLKEEFNKQDLKEDFYYAYYLIGYNYKKLKRYDKAIFYEIQALEYVKQDQYEIKYSNTIMMIGNCYAELGVNDKAIKLFEISAKLYEAIGVTKWYVVSIFNIHRVNKDIKKMKETIDLYKNVLNKKGNKIYNEKIQIDNTLNEMKQELLNEMEYAYAN